MITVHDFSRPQEPSGIRYVVLDDGPMPLLGRPAQVWQSGDMLIVGTVAFSQSKTITLPHMREKRLAEYLLREWEKTS